MNTAHTLAESARVFADQPAIVIDDQTDCDYGELAHRVACRAGALHESGVKPGGRVVLYLKNRPDYIEALFAIWWAGAVAVPLSSMLHAREAASIIDDVRAQLTWVGEDLADELMDVCANPGKVGILAAENLAHERNFHPLPIVDRRPEDDAWIFFTSGTTGKPKGARLTHANLWAMTTAYCADVEWVDERSSLLHLALQSHASGLFALPFIAKGAAQIVPSSTDPAHVATLMRTRDNMTFFVPPIMLRRLCSAPEIKAAPVERMGTVLVGAAPVLAEDLIAGMATFGARLWNGYGQGESPCTITAMGPRAMATAAAENNRVALESVGAPRIGTQVRVVDDDGNTVQDGEIGEVIVKGPTVMAGYLDNPEATAETLRDGWLFTGDLGRFDAGLLTLLDRSKDLVISGGANIYPREVEQTLRQHAGVLDVAVIGIPDEEWGERLAAFVVLHPDQDTHGFERSLDEHCLSMMARYKRPKEYHLITELPRNGAGKVLKTTLREQLTAHAHNKE
ncbi:MAG: class I adenylate-forming enzyme family protein [Actinomycetes bacterium]